MVLVCYTRARKRKDKITVLDNNMDHGSIVVAPKYNDRNMEVEENDS